MNKNDYLDSEMVSIFIEWLRFVIVSPEAFHQSFRARNGKGKKVTLKNFESAVMAYSYDQRNLVDTLKVLEPLSTSLQSAIDCVNGGYDADVEYEALLDCLKILVWRGKPGRSMINWLIEIFDNENLTRAIRCGSQSLTSDLCSALSPYGNPEVLRSDSAASRLYAMANDESIVYDNRVSAAFAKLACEYLYQTYGMYERELPETLAFMVKRGDERRDPTQLPMIRFTPKATGYLHAKWNQRANWIVESLLSDNNVSQALSVYEGVSPQKSLEAALFVMGDDIRSLSVKC